MPAAKPSSLVDTRVIYCGDNLEQLKNLPDACVDLIYRGGGRDKRGTEDGRANPPFNSNRNYDGPMPDRNFRRGETKEKRAFEDRRGCGGDKWKVGGWATESTRAYIDYMRPRWLELARVSKQR